MYSMIGPWHELNVRKKVKGQGHAAGVGMQLDMAALVSRLFLCLLLLSFIGPDSQLLSEIYPRKTQENNS